MLRKLSLLWLFGACASAPPPPPLLEIRPEVPPPSARVLEPAPFDVAWTARGGISLLQKDREGTIVLRPFTRVEVLGLDTGGLRVRCSVCTEPVEGILGPEDVVYRALPPEIAAWGTLPEFALALRTAVVQERLDLLEPVMTGDFTQSLVGPQNPSMALEVWLSESLATLSRLPDLLEQGLSTRDTVIWTAPPAYTESLYYRGPRAGFRRRADGRWEWLFLISGLRPDE